MSYFYKPELALRRALELESIKQPDAALALLHEVLSSRRHRTWGPTYEQIMITYLNLCLALHKSREAKDGLHQYRNLSQSQAPGSLEKVIRYLMDAAEKKCVEAKALSDISLLVDVDEDEFGASVMSTMSADPMKTQRDSALLLPSVKFLWETYRAVLDILKSNSKLEHVYHAAATGALNFCRTYKRRTEFRRLCDMLRMHLGNLQKYGSLVQVSEADQKSTNGKVRGWEGWTTESIELHLQTRFVQLETASCLHLYTEGFRTVEDIYNILQVSHARRKNYPNAPPPKAKLMAAYYEKLTTLFWVSENYLFHAFAWYKYYTLCKEYNRGMSEEMKQMQASAVLLATLCIPTHTHKTKPSHGITSTAEDDIVKEKMSRMATLLGFHTRHPTREALLLEIKSTTIMESVPKYLKDLYLLLEENSDPLIMVEQAKPLLENLTQEIGATNETDNEDFEDNTLGRYVKPLTSVLMLKLLMNLSAAYHTVTLDHLKSLTEGLGVTFDQVEKTIVLFTQTKNVSVRIDHRAGCLRFGSPHLESDMMRSQLTTLAKKLETLVEVLQPADPQIKVQARAAQFHEIRTNLVSEHAAVLERKNLIEMRKEEVERLALEKVREAERLKAEEEAARKVEEDKRLVREQRLREKEKVRKVQKEMEALEKKKYLQAMGRNVDNMTEEEVAQIDTEALAKEHADKANKKRDEAERKQREAAKRLDYLVRAVRIEELPLIKTKYEEKIKADRERYEAEIIEKAKKAREQWEADVKEKAQLNTHSVFKYMAEFESAVMVGRKKLHKQLCMKEDERAELEAEKGKLARARKRKMEEQKRIAAEQAKREAEEAARIAAEEKARKEEEKRHRLAEEEKRRLAELARMQEERNLKEQERNPPPATAKYVPPTKRGGTGSGFADRSGGYGGGRYEGRQQGGDRWGAPDGGNSRGGFDDRRSGGGASRGGFDDRRSGGGSSRGGFDDRRSAGGPSRGGGPDDRRPGGSERPSTFGRRDDRERGGAGGTGGRRL